MSRETAVLSVLIAYKLMLVIIAWWASRKVNDTQDFFLASRQLGPWVTAISASASTSSAWTLLGISGVAYLWGVSVFWLLPGVILGYLINWYWVAPRLRRLSEQERSMSLTDVLAHQQVRAPLIRKLCSLVIVFSFSFYIAAQFQAAGTTFAMSFNIDMSSSILLGAVIILFYTLLGGFLAVSVTDAVQGLLMAATAIFLPLFALLAVGGPWGLVETLHGLEQPELVSLSGKHQGLLAFGFILGSLGVGLANPGQPHVVNRFMAIKNEKAIGQARVISLFWAVIVFGGMMLLGLCARALQVDTTENDQVFFAMTNTLLSPIIAGVVLAAVLSAIMSTADSQLLVCAAAIAHDLKGKNSEVKEKEKAQLWQSRIAVFGVCALAVLLALYAPQAIFTRVLFAWTALGAAFGPLLLVRLLGYRVSSGYTIAAILGGFFLTVILHLQPSPPGDVWERFIPLSFALICAWRGRTKKHASTASEIPVALTASEQAS